MSGDATTWAWGKQGLRPLHKLVLLCLAGRAGDAGKENEDIAWPSYESICEDTGADRKTVWQAITELLDRGLLEDTGARTGRTNQISVFRLIGVPHPKLKEHQKGNDSENGTVPFLSGNSSENGMVKDSENGIRNLSKESIKNRKVVPAVSGASFEEFWERYPRKVSKSAAGRAWTKLDPSPTLMAEMTCALERQKASPDWQRDAGRYIPHAATWLHNRRWEDELPAAHNQTEAGSGSSIFEGAL